MLAQSGHSLGEGAGQETPTNHRPTWFRRHLQLRASPKGYRCFSHRCPCWLIWLKNRGRFLAYPVVQSTTRASQRFSKKVSHQLGPPLVPFCQLFWGGGFPYSNRLQEKDIVPTYSKRSTGGPSKPSNWFHCHISCLSLQQFAFGPCLDHWVLLGQSSLGRLAGARAFAAPRRPVHRGGGPLAPQRKLGPASGRISGATFHFHSF